MELVLPAGSGVRRRTVPAELVPVDSALRRFLDTDPVGLSESAGAWSAVVVAGLNLVACGRIMPAVTPSGFDAWRVGPLEAADEALIGELATALPPVAHCLARSARTPIEVASPEHLSARCGDARPTFSCALRPPRWRLAPISLRPAKLSRRASSAHGWPRRAGASAGELPLACGSSWTDSVKPWEATSGEAPSPSPVGRRARFSRTANTPSSSPPTRRSPPPGPLSR